MAGYINLSNTFIYNAEDRVHQNWTLCVLADNTNYLYQHILIRGNYLTIAPISAIVHALDIIIGLSAGAATVVTLGIEPHTAHFASRHLFSSNYILSKPYMNLLMTINPTAKIAGFETPGIFSHLAKRPLKNLANGFKGSDHFLVRHVAARLTFALTGLALIITRVVDAILGLIAAALSFLTLGLFKPVNTMAFCGLQATGVVNDLFFCMMKTINPWSQVRF